MNKLYERRWLWNSYKLILIRQNYCGHLSLSSSQNQRLRIIAETKTAVMSFSHCLVVNTNLKSIPCFGTYIYYTVCIGLYTECVILQIGICEWQNLNRWEYLMREDEQLSGRGFAHDPFSQECAETQSVLSWISTHWHYPYSLAESNWQGRIMNKNIITCSVLTGVTHSLQTANLFKQFPCIVYSIIQCFSVFVCFYYSICACICILCEFVCLFLSFINISFIKLFIKPYKL